MKLITYPNPILKKKTKEVTEFGIWSDTINQMIAIMVEKKGYGLAANQVGLDANFFIMYPDKDLPPKSYFNCTIKETVGDLEKMRESCLSLPDVSEDISRYKQITIEYQDKDGNKLTETLPEGIASQCAQHEMDHLKGLLYIDHLDMIKKERIIKKYNRLKFGSSKCT